MEMHKKRLRIRSYLPLIHQICGLCNVSYTDVMSESRKRELSYTRGIIALKLRASGLTVEEIGILLDRGHAAISSACKTLKDSVLPVDSMWEYRHRTVMDLYVNPYNPGRSYRWVCWMLRQLS